MTIQSGDARRWSAAPDLLFGEALATDAIAGGISPKYLHAERDACVPFSVREAPEDASGRALTMLIFPAGGDRATLTFSSYDAHWKLNGREHLWEATPLGGGDYLECDWVYPTVTTFKAEVKAKEGYRLFHLGPIFWQPSDPSLPPYVLVVTSGTSDEPNHWNGEQPQMIPLTVGSVKRQVDDATKPIEWRVQFLVWLWCQPQPVAGAEGFLLDVFDRPGDYPVSLRWAAARSLLELKYEPARTPLLATVRNKHANTRLRARIIRGMDRMFISSQRVDILSTIARDSRDAKEVREAALRSLAETDHSMAWDTIGALTNDGDVGKTAQKLLANRDKRDSE